MPRVTVGRGGWITKTDAMKKFHLASSNLESILPVSDVCNPRNSTGRIKKYNIADVEALELRLRSGTSASASGSATIGGLALASGPLIMRTNTMKEFGLKSCQMDRLRPVKVTPNRHPNAKGPTRFYNRSDVQALADTVVAAAAAPTGAPRSNSSHQRGDYDNDRNIFDGMTGEDTAFALAAATGIVGPAMSYSR